MRREKANTNLELSFTFSIVVLTRTYLRIGVRPLFGVHTKMGATPSAVLTLSWQPMNTFPVFYPLRNALPRFSFKSPSASQNSLLIRFYFYPGICCSKSLDFPIHFFLFYMFFSFLPFRGGIVNLTRKQFTINRESLIISQDPSKEDVLDVTLNWIW